MKISQYTNGDPPQDTDKFVIARGSNNFHLTWANIKLGVSSLLSALYLKLDQSTPQTVTGIPVFSNGLNAGGAKITNLENGTAIKDAANIENLINTYNVSISYWLQGSNAIRFGYVASVGYYAQTPTQTAEQALTNAYWSAAVLETPAPFVIKNGAEFIVHFKAKVTSTSGKKSAIVRAKLYYADADGVSNLTQVGSDTNDSEILTSSLVLQELHGVCTTEVSIPTGKRLVVKMFSVCSGAAASYPEIQIEYGDVHDHLSIPVAGEILGNFVQKAFVITATSPITIDGGASADMSTTGRTIAISPASGSSAGSMSAADFVKSSHIGVCTFYASLSSSVSNVTGDNTIYTLVCDAEKYDLGGNYNTGDGKFTAPYTGTYILSAYITVQQVYLANHTEIDVLLIVEGTSAYTYTFATTNILSGITTYPVQNISVIYMTAGDTCKLGVAVYGNSKVSDIYGNATNLLTRFQGTFIG